MGVGIIEILVVLIFLACQSDQAIVVQVDSHWANDRCY